MSQPQKQENAMTVPEKDMKDIVALCKRRGFIFPASEIYGGINGFWDFGPLGTELKNNLRDLWWKHMVITPPIGPDGEPLQIVGVDTAIIQNPKSWEASGHVGGFNDPMVDCTETKKRYRADHLVVLFNGDENDPGPWPMFEIDATEEEIEKRLKKLKLGRREDYRFSSVFTNSEVALKHREKIIGPDAKEPGTLTEPRQFNMMFHSTRAPRQAKRTRFIFVPKPARGFF